MDLILSSAGGVEERFVTDTLDMDLGQTNDFQLTVSYGTWQGDLTDGKRIYVPDTEYGGIIKTIKTATNTDQIFVSGFTWRGYLAKRIIIPPAGQDYYIANGELNQIISELVQIPSFIVADASTGINIRYQFKRYCTVLDGLTDMLASVGYRLKIEYKQTDLSGYVVLSAVPAYVYNDELSQDSGINFFSEDYKQGVNHLICLGIGELKDRVVVHLYADKNGNISQRQTMTGINEIVSVFESPSSDREQLIEQATDRFKTLINYKSFTANLNNNTLPELGIGDSITGRDYITGMVVSKPIVDKVIKIENGMFSAQYKIKGENDK